MSKASGSKTNTKSNQEVNIVKDPIEYTRESKLSIDKLKTDESKIKNIVDPNSELANDYKRIKDAKPEKVKLSDDEIIELQDNTISLFKKIPLDYINSLFKVKYKKDYTQEEEKTFEIISAEMLRINNEFSNLIKEEKIQIGDKKSVDELLKQLKKNSLITYDLNKKMNKEVLVELQENEKILKEKQKAIKEEEQLLLKKENILKLNSSVTNVNSSQVNSKNILTHSISIGPESLANRELIDSNIRNSRLKEIKKIKENLDSKLKTVEIQVHKILEEEAAAEFDKKNVLKNYLQNFEKDQNAANDKSKQNQDEYKRRSQILKEKEEYLKKLPLIIREEEVNKVMIEKQERVKKLKQFQNEQREKFNQKVSKFKALENEDESKEKSPEKLFKKWEKYEKEKIIEREKQIKDQIQIVNLEKRNLLKPLKREEFEEFARKVSEDRKKYIEGLNKKRNDQLEIDLLKNASLPKGESAAYQRFIAELNEKKELKEKEKLDKIYRNMKIQNFSKLVHEKLPPKIDESKKLQIEERIEKLKDKRVKRNKDLKKKVVSYKLIKGKSRSKSKGENRDVSLKLLDPGNNLIRSRSEQKSKRELKPIVIKKPLDKHPDYLKEIRSKKGENEGILLI